MDLNYISDIHIHPSLKGYPNQESIWKFLPTKAQSCEKLSGAIRGGLNELSKSSQANLDKVLNGELRVIFASLYPVERDFFRISRRHLVLRLFLKKRHLEPLATCVSGLPRTKVHAIFKRIEENRGINYFTGELEKEYRYLLDQAGRSPQPYKKFRLLRDYDDLQSLRNDEPETIGVFLTVEGAHALGDYSRDRYFKVPYEELTDREKEELKESFSRNIEAVKNWGNGDHAPVFITFCHHFWNQLAGHAKSFSNRGFLSLVPGMDRLFNQSVGINQGFTELGRHVLERLLDGSGGRRILVDTKHMSVTARQQYYSYLEERDDEIPLICSHAACNGWHSHEDSAERSDRYGLDRGEYFSRWSINMDDDDIRAFRRHGGLIGIVLHEGRMPGGRSKKRFKKMKKKGLWYSLRKEYVRLILSNMFHIARVVGSRDAWEMICIGSDFDGLIDPFNQYDDVEKLKILLSEMKQYLEFDDESYDLTVYENNREVRIGRDRMEMLRYGLTPDEIIENIAYKNVERFLKKHLR